MFRWDSATPLGWPVLPEVYCKNARSAGPPHRGAASGSDAVKPSGDSTATSGRSVRATSPASDVARERRDLRRRHQETRLRALRDPEDVAEEIVRPRDEHR